MLNPNELLYQKARQDNLRREIENQARHLSDAETSDKASHPSSLYASALAKLGDVMVNVGSELQSRYGNFAEEV